MKLTCLRCGFALAVTALAVTGSSAQTIYSNGGILTNPGVGSFGADVSQASAAVNSGGVSSFLSGAGPGFRMSDEFTVPVGQTWTVTGVSNMMYITSAAGTYGNPPSSPITSINLNIWNGNPSLGTSSIVATSTTIGSATWTNIYRTFNGTLVNDQRPVFNVQASFPGVILNPGTYFMDVQANGTSPNGTITVFMPFVMTAPGGVPFTPVGNSLQMSAAGVWATALVGAPTQGVDLPFSIQGSVAVPEPTTVALLAILTVGASSGWYLRRKKRLADAQQSLSLSR